MKVFLVVATIILTLGSTMALAQLAPGQVYGQANNSQYQALQNRIQAQQQHQRNMLQAQQDLQRKLQDINFRRQTLATNPTLPPQQKQQQFQQLNQEQMQAQQQFQGKVQGYNQQLQQSLNPNYKPGLQGTVKRFFQGSSCR